MRTMGDLCLPRRPGDENRAAGDLAILDHLQDDRSSLSSLFLPDETLGCGSGFEGRRINTESADMRMSGDEVQTSKVLGFGHGHHRLEPKISFTDDGNLPGGTHCSHIVSRSPKSN